MVIHGRGSRSEASCGDCKPPGACNVSAEPGAASCRSTAKIGEPARRSKRSRQSAESWFVVGLVRNAPRFELVAMAMRVLLRKVMEIFLAAASRSAVELALESEGAGVALPGAVVGAVMGMEKTSWPACFSCEPDWEA